MGLWALITLKDSDPATEAQYRRFLVKELQEQQLPTFFYLCIAIVIGLFIAFNHGFDTKYLLLCGWVALFPACMTLLAFGKNEAPPNPLKNHHLTVTPAAPGTPSGLGDPEAGGRLSPSPSSTGGSRSSSRGERDGEVGASPAAASTAVAPAASAAADDLEQGHLQPPRLHLLGMIPGRRAQYAPLEMEETSSYYSSSPMSVARPPGRWDSMKNLFGGPSGFALVVWNALGAFGYLSFSSTLLLEQYLCLSEPSWSTPPQSCGPILQHAVPPHLVLFMTAAPMVFGVLNINWVLIGGVNLILIAIQGLIFYPLIDRYHLWFLSFLQVLWMVYCSLSVRKTQVRKRREYADKVQSNKQLSSLIEARKSAQEAHDQKRDFVNYIFHEVRVQFHNLAQGLDVVFQTKANRSNEELETLFVMGSAADLMSRMLNGVLDLAKLEDGKFVPKKTPFDFLALVRDIIRTFQTTAKSKNVSLAIDSTHPSLRQLDGCFVRWDPLRYQEILSNFLSNALKFTNSNGKVTVKCQIVMTKEEDVGKVPPNHIILRTCVIDTGIGILPRDQQKLFKPFIQGNSSAASSPTRGTGLGLAICRRLCYRCDFKSEYQKGSEFWFDIVVDLRPTGNSQPVEMPPKEAKGYYFTTCSLYDLKSINKPQSQKILAGKSVLIVDDTDQMFTMKNLQRLGCMSVHHVPTGEEALQKCQEQHIDLVIMDHNLGGKKDSPHQPMNGVETTSALKSLHPGIFVVGLSGTMNTALSEQWMQAGASKVLVKPATQQILQNVAQELFQQP